MVLFLDLFRLVDSHLETLLEALTINPLQGQSCIPAPSLSTFMDVQNARSITSIHQYLLVFCSCYHLPLCHQSQYQGHQGCWLTNTGSMLGPVSADITLE